MPMLNWDPLDVLSVLAVEPIDIEHGESLYYFRETPLLYLALTVWPYESTVAFSVGMRGSPAPILSFSAFVRDGIIRRETPDFEWLVFRDVIVAPVRFSYLQMLGIFDRQRRPECNNLTLVIVPEIRLEFDR